MYTPQKLDKVLSLFPSNGEFGVIDKISDPELKPILKYLEAKNLVQIKESEKGVILGAWLTNIGIAYVHEGGFSAIEKKRKSISRQFIKDRRIKIWIPVLAAILGSLVTLLVQYLITLIR